MKSKQKKLLEFILRFQTQLGLMFLLLAIILILIPSLPQIWYRVFPESTNNEVTSISQLQTTPTTSITNSKLPEKDLSLPKTNYIKIPKIGVNATLKNNKDYVNTLRYGAWMVNDFPTPNELKKPVIVASHRFGYLDWSAKQRKEISFYNLPKLKNGDIIEIIWDQRKYKYKIVDSSEGSDIKSYKHDLILYTCKLYNSPIRIFKYAERVIE